MCKSIIPVALTAVISLLSSCMPVPSTTPVFPTLMGYVVDAEGYAVPGATVIAERAGYVRQGKTSKVGKFILPPVTQSHYAMISGPPGVKPPPWFWQRESQLIPLTLTASAPGYEATMISIPSRRQVPFLLELPDRIQLQLFIGSQPAVAIPD